MTELLTKFWFETKNGLGIGVTAYDLKDAIKIIQSNPQLKSYIPIYERYKEGIKFDELDQNHVVPNMGIIAKRGVWFPNINSA